MKERHTPDYYTTGIINGDRTILGKAITLMESTLPQDQALSLQLLDKIIAYTGKASRIGITGIPGVGKSTFIEALGKHIIHQGHTVAVLTIDPSSPRTRGSILGDKTRMEKLSKDANAFIRPSAAHRALGGVTHKTREAMLLCEAAGYDVIIIETVGVGQSEVAVRNMVDFFLLLMLPGAGDELQGIKRGIMEMADAIVITKADGDNIKRATSAQADYQHAVHLFPAPPSGWVPKVTTTSALTGVGVGETWEMIQQYMQETRSNGFHIRQRQQQNVTWMHEYFHDLVQHQLHADAALRNLRVVLEGEVQALKKSPYAAAQAYFSAYQSALGNKSQNQN